MNNNKLILLLVLFIAISCNEQNSQSEQEKIYNANLSILTEISWNKKDLSSLDNIIDVNYSRIINNVSIASNPNELKANMQVFQTGFPDLFIDINKITFKDNHAFLAWTFTGTNTGIFGEKPPTGKKVKVNGFSMIQFNNKGKIFKEEIYYNELDFLQQLGYTLTPPNFE